MLSVLLPNKRVHEETSHRGPKITVTWSKKALHQVNTNNCSNNKKGEYASPRVKHPGPPVTQQGKANADYGTFVYSPAACSLASRK